MNTVFAQLNIEVGPDKTRDVATRAGITTTIGANPANVLGTDDVLPRDMADAYATFAAKGLHSAPFIIRSATRLKDGAVAYQGAGTPKQVFTPEVMADVTYAMTRVVQDPLGTGAKWIKPLGRPIAGKTGTSTDNHSAWFVGFTPQIATAVAFYQPVAQGTGQDVITPFGRNVSEITGGTWPAALWASYMKPVFELPKYSPVVPFPDRSNINRKAPTSAPTVPSTPTDTPTTAETPAPSPAAATVAVPAGLAGMKRADAEAAILNAGLVASPTEKADASVVKGNVISASPGAGSPVAAGSTVTLVVSSGPAPSVAPTPGGASTSVAP